MKRRRHLLSFFMAFVLMVSISVIPLKIADADNVYIETQSEPRASETQTKTKNYSIKCYNSSGTLLATATVKLVGIYSTTDSIAKITSFNVTWSGTYKSNFDDTVNSSTAARTLVIKYQGDNLATLKFTLKSTGSVVTSPSKYNGLSTIKLTV